MKIKLLDDMKKGKLVTKNYSRGGAFVEVHGASACTCSP